MITAYSGISPKADLQLIERLSEKLQGRTMLHVNSTRTGGGVAEILQRMVPLIQSLGIYVRWEVIGGDEYFFEITKKFHNALQGNTVEFRDDMWTHHIAVNEANTASLNLDADAIWIHDPQPIPLVDHKKQGVWVWRCHIDASEPQADVLHHLSGFCKKYDASIFSVARYARFPDVSSFVIPPSIDPLSDKNRDLTAEEVSAALQGFGIPQDRPMLLQVSRFDRFKDPLGVIQAYRLVKKYNDCILVLAGSSATDDPEGEQVLHEVREHAAGDPDIFVLLLPASSDLAINALQRAATIVMQKSIREGFGLTVSEAMWKGKPVIGGATGGIPLQIIDGQTGVLVHTGEGAAFRTRQLLNNAEMAKRIGYQAREFVRSNFLLTRQIRDYLALWAVLMREGRLTGEYSL
jgi:trehalose synthase